MWNIVTKLSYPINYSWRIGFSALHGTFYKNKRNLNQSFRQSIYSVNLIFSQGFWNIESEVFFNQYKTPRYDAELQDFVKIGSEYEKISLQNFSYYSTIKYEPPWLSGLFIAYRFDMLAFGDDPTANNEASWDNNVIRHSIGLSYKIINELSVRMSVSRQHTDNRNWNGKQQTLRVILSYGF